MNPLVQKQPDLNQLFEKFKQNPLQYLTGIPQGMTSPQEIVQYLSNNGRIPAHLQSRVNAMLGRK